MKTIIVFILSCMILPTIYSQCVEGDCENGSGIMVFSSGNKYKGEFQNGQRHGQGTFVWASGAKYNGQWEYDKMHGSGTYIYPDRRVYRGEFVNGLKEGKGTLTGPDKEIIQKGTWENDLFVDPDAQTYSHLSIGTAVLAEDFFPDIPAAGTLTYINPSFISYDYGINSFLSVGALFAYASIGVSPDNAEIEEADYTYLIMGGRSTVHFNVIGDNTFVPYIKGMIGYSFAGGNTENSARFEAPENKLAFNAHVGIKSFILKNLGLFVEGGLGISQLNAGVNMRF